MLIGVAAGAWWAWIFGPAYLDQFDVKEDVWLAFSTMLTDESGARAKLLRDLNEKVGWHYAVDEATGLEEVRPGLGIEPEQIEMTIAPEVNLLRVRVEYDRVLQLKPTSRRTTVHFVAEQTGKIK